MNHHSRLFLVRFSAAFLAQLIGAEIPEETKDKKNTSHQAKSLFDFPNVTFIPRECLNATHDSLFCLVSNAIQVARWMLRDSHLRYN